MKTISSILNHFISRIRGADTSIDENYIRIPTYLFYEILEETKQMLLDLFIANK